MSLPHFFLEGQVLSQEAGEAFALRLSEGDLKHVRALRLVPGEHIAVIDAAQDYFECEIVEATRDGVVARVAQHLDAPEEGAQVLLVQGIAKGEKMDDVVRHATEIGVAGIVPFASARSIVKLDARKAAARAERWRAIAKSAAMQSGRRTIPEIAEVSGLSEVCELVRGAHAVLVCWEEASAGNLREALSRALAAQWIRDPRDARVAVVVGPEGGLEAREVEALMASNRFAATISLGSTILRTETAGLIAPALALYELGGLGNESADEKTHAAREDREVSER